MSVAFVEALLVALALLVLLVLLGAWWLAECSW